MPAPGVNVIVCGVLAGRYKGKDIGERALLTHALADGDTKAFCRRIEEEALVPDVPEPPGTPPTCPVCAERYAKWIATKGTPS